MFYYILIINLVEKLKGYVGSLLLQISSEDTHLITLAAIVCVHESTSRVIYVEHIDRIVSLHFRSNVNKIFLKINLFMNSNRRYVCQKVEDGPVLAFVKYILTFSILPSIAIAITLFETHTSSFPPQLYRHYDVYVCVYIIHI